MAFNIQARVDFRRTVKARMGVWEAMEKLNTLVDESDPDVSNPVSSYPIFPWHPSSARATG